MEIRIETALNVHPTIIESLAPIVNEWIVDIKSLNPTIFNAYTNHNIIQSNMSFDLFCELGSS